MKSIYLDNNASTPLIPEVRDQLRSLIGQPIVNPSSPHTLGARARHLVEDARFKIADAIETERQNIVFVSSGSEANTMALTSVKRIPKDENNIVTTSVEHSSIRKNISLLSSEGFAVREVAVKQDGIIDIELLEKVVNRRTALVSIQWVNNETGVIQPVDEACEIAHRNGALFHCDAAQAFGKFSVKMTNHGFDFISLTAHKIGGPQGCGALYARNIKDLSPIIGGGEQEHGLRGGTENVLGIVGFGLAAEYRNHSLNTHISHMQKCRDRFETLVKKAESEVFINGSVEFRVCNTTNIRFPVVDGRMLLAKLNEAGIYCSQSSACTTGYPESSYVLRAMGLNEDEAYSSIRFSFGLQNTVEEAEEAANIVVNKYHQVIKLLGAPN